MKKKIIKSGDGTEHITVEDAKTHRQFLQVFLELKNLISLTCKSEMETIHAAHKEARRLHAGPDCEDPQQQSHGKTRDPSCPELKM
jgi:hypothetical protein